MDKLENTLKLLERNTPKSDCKFYNWGGDLDKGFSIYPREYGARCEKYKEFFYRNGDNILTPNCYKCKENEQNTIKRKTE